MMLEGERIKTLLAGAREEVILCAPFIKCNALRVLLGVVPAGVPARIVTRWRPAEVAAGVSDLEVFDLIKDRPGTRLSILNDLHAKLFLADKRCLVGSANITGAALGWSADPNVELLVGVERNDIYVETLIRRLQDAVSATFQLKAQVAEEAEQITSIEALKAADIQASEVEKHQQPWFPRCAAPEKLFSVYQDNITDSVVAGTRTDALADLFDLSLPAGLPREQFYGRVGETLEKIPALDQIISKISGQLTDDRAVGIIKELRSDFSDKDARRQWSIVRDWINEFLDHKYEVAAESFVVRIKS